MKVAQFFQVNLVAASAIACAVQPKKPWQGHERCGGCPSSSRDVTLEWDCDRLASAPTGRRGGLSWLFGLCELARLLQCYVPCALHEIAGHDAAAICVAWPNAGQKHLGRWKTISSHDFGNVCFQQRSDLTAGVVPATGRALLPFFILLGFSAIVFQITLPPARGIATALIYDALIDKDGLF